MVTAVWFCTQNNTRHESLYQSMNDLLGLLWLKCGNGKKNVFVLIARCACYIRVHKSPSALSMRTKCGCCFHDNRGIFWQTNKEKLSLGKISHVFYANRPKTKMIWMQEERIQKHKALAKSDRTKIQMNLYERVVMMICYSKTNHNWTNKHWLNNELENIGWIMLNRLK